MLNISGFRKINIYSKLVLTFLIVLLPLNGIALYVSSRGAEHVEKEILTSVQSKMAFYMTTFESEITRTLQSQHSFVSDYDVMNLSTQANFMDQNAKREAILRLQQRLELLVNTSSFLSHVTMHIPLLERSITDKRVLDSISEDYKSLREYSSRYDAPIVKWNERMFINLIYPPERTIQLEDKAPLFVLTLEIAQSRLQHVLGQLAGSYHGEAFLISNGDIPWTLGSSLNTTISEHLWNEILQTIPLDSVSYITNLKTTEGQYIVAAERSSETGILLAAVIPTQQVMGSLKQYKQWSWLIMSMTIIMIFIFSFGLYRIIHTPLRRLVGAFRIVEKGEFNVTIGHPNEDEFGYLYARFNEMVLQVKRLIQEVYEQKYRLQLSELKQLQSQINPHFLYNSHFSMYYMAKNDDKENLMRFIKYMGDYFQYITRNGSNEMILREEINHAITYGNIQEMRFQVRIRFTIVDIPTVVDTILVPRLILQPIVENAYKHGLENKEEAGVLAIRFIVAADRLEIVIEDNADLSENSLVAMHELLSGQNGAGETTGMLNVHRRLQIKYGPTSGLRLARGTMGGLCVSIVIPLAKQEGEEDYASSARC